MAPSSPVTEWLLEDEAELRDRIRLERRMVADLLAMNVALRATIERSKVRLHPEPVPLVS